MYQVLERKKNGPRSIIQTSLKIGQPGDKYEQEADAVADRVMRMSESETMQMQPIEEEEEEMIQPKLRMQPIEEEEEMLQPKSDIGGGFASPEIHQQINSSKGNGRSLMPATNHFMSNAFGSDFSDVKVHTDSRAVEMNQQLNARAFTYGNNIYFNKTEYNPDSSGGRGLLAHELTHVVQQGTSADLQKKDIIQRDITANLETTNGEFEFETEATEGASETPATNHAELDTDIKFTPSTDSPYSNEIRIIQIVNLKDNSGNNVDPASLPTGRGADLRTQEADGSDVEEGFFTDVLHQNFNNAGPTAVSARHSQKGLAYEGGTPIFGFKRSNDLRDIKAAEIEDTPGGGGNFNFDFETVAKGEDTNTIYGALTWGFITRNGNVRNEYVGVDDSQSATFDAAIERHREFYTHEPVMLYFGYDEDFLRATELAKIPEILNYLAEFPDTSIGLEGYADRRGSVDYNLDLSLRRAEEVRRVLVEDNNLDESRVDPIAIGFGETEEFTSGNLAPNPGRGQDLEANRRGNRRVVARFNRDTVPVP